MRAGDHVRVVVGGDCGTFAGTGTVTGRDMKSTALWVTLDAIPPAWLRRFPVGDNNRNKHVLVDRECIVEVL